MTDKITFSNSFGEKYHMPVNGAHTMRVGSKSPKTKLTVEQHDPRCAVVRSGDLRAWCDCGQGMADDNALAEQLKTVLQREADTQRRHDEKVERLEAEIERLREALELADAALRGANMNMNVVERKVHVALGETK